MNLGQLKSVIDQLLANGVPTCTPVCLTEDGSLVELSDLEIHHGGYLDEGSRGLEVRAQVGPATFLYLGVVASEEWSEVYEDEYQWHVAAGNVRGVEEIIRQALADNEPVPRETP